MQLTFANVRRPRRLQELRPEEAVRASRLGKYAGRDRTATQRFSGSSHASIQELEVWDLLDEHGRPAYQLWTDTSSGLLFDAGSNEVVGTVSSFELSCPDGALRDAVAAAAQVARRDCVESAVAALKIPR